MCRVLSTESACLAAQEAGPERKKPGFFGETGFLSLIPLEPLTGVYGSRRRTSTEKASAKPEPTFFLIAYSDSMSVS